MCKPPYRDKIHWLYSLYKRSKTWQRELNLLTNPLILHCMHIISCVHSIYFPVECFLVCTARKQNFLLVSSPKKQCFPVCHCLNACWTNRVCEGVKTAKPSIPVQLDSLSVVLHHPRALSQQQLNWRHVLTHPHCQHQGDLLIPHCCGLVSISVTLQSVTRRLLPDRQNNIYDVAP